MAILKFQKSLTTRQALAQLKAGDTMVFDMETTNDNTLRNYASDLGLFLRRKYRVHRNREDRTIEITRTL